MHLSVGVLDIEIGVRDVVCKQTKFSIRSRFMATSVYLVDSSAVQNFLILKFNCLTL